MPYSVVSPKPSSEGRTQCLACRPNLGGGWRRLWMDDLPVPDRVSYPIPSDVVPEVSTALSRCLQSSRLVIHLTLGLVLQSPCLLLNPIVSCHLLQCRGHKMKNERSNLVYDVLLLLYNIDAPCLAYALLLSAEVYSTLALWALRASAPRARFLRLRARPTPTFRSSLLCSSKPHLDRPLTRPRLPPPRR